MPPPPTTFSSDAILALLPYELVPAEYRCIVAQCSDLGIGIPPPVQGFRSQTVQTIERTHPEYAGFGYQILLAAWRVRLCGDRFVFRRWFPDLDARGFQQLVAEIDPKAHMDSVRRTFQTVLDAALAEDVTRPWKEFRSRVALRPEFLCVLALSNEYQLTLLHSAADITLDELRAIREELRAEISLLCFAVRESTFDNIKSRVRLFPKNQHLVMHWLLLRRSKLGCAVMDIMGWHPSPMEIRALESATMSVGVYQSLI